jgi:histidyl-tRNA synthetase
LKETKVKPRLPSGFPEFLPQEQLVFDRMLQTIRLGYQRFGFTPIETPTIELSEVLLAKGGGDTDKEVYRFKKGDTDLCLHFDLTVPLARYVTQHYHDLTFPFRRYQLQKVWRGERAQHGRCREFYQCDIDVIGSDNPLVDAEIPSIIYAVFGDLGYEDIMIRVSNKMILNGLLETLNLGNDAALILKYVDKIEKIGEEKVIGLLLELGVSRQYVDTVMRFASITGSPEDVFSQLQAFDCQNPTFQEGVSRLGTVCSAMLDFGVPSNRFCVDLSVARGLDYYTGTVYETSLTKYPKVGSVSSGGRYDNLAGYYTDKHLPGVGISIGLTRLFIQLRDAKLLQFGQVTPTEVLVIRADTNVPHTECIRIATVLRQARLNVQIYLDDSHMQHQLGYANKLGVPFVVMVRETDLAEGTVILKNMATREQQTIPLEVVAGLVKPQPNHHNHTG